MKPPPREAIPLDGSVDVLEVARDGEVGHLKMLLDELRDVYSDDMELFEVERDRKNGYGYAAIHLATIRLYCAL